MLLSVIDMLLIPELRNYEEGDPHMKIQTRGAFRGPFLERISHYSHIIYHPLAAKCKVPSAKCHNGRLSLHIREGITNP